MSRRRESNRDTRTEPVRLLPAAGVLVVWIALLPGAGGFNPRDWLPAGLVLLGLVVLAMWGGRQLVPRAHHARTVLFALTAFTLWSYLSIVWSDARGDSLDAANLLLVTLLSGWAIALVPWRPRTAELGVLAFAVASAIVCAVTLIGAIGAADTIQNFTDGRFDQPLDYPNASAAFCVMLALPTLVVGARPAAGVAVKALALGTASFLLAFALLPQSRASVLGGAFAIVVLMLAVPFRWRLLGALIIAGAAAAVAAQPAIAVLDVANTSGDIGAALTKVGWALLGTTLIGAAGGTALALVDRNVSPSQDFRDRARLGGRVATGIALLAILAVGVANAGRIGDGVSNQWTSLKHPGERFTGAANPTTGGRLTGADPLERYDYFRVTIVAFRASPVGGIGIGGFEHLYDAERRYDKPSKYPHNLVLRVLGEGGVIGFGIWLAFVIAVAAGLWRGLRSTARNERALAASSLAVLGYFAVHSSLDWVEAYPTITGPALALVLVALVACDQAERLERLVGDRPPPAVAAEPGRRRLAVPSLPAPAARVVAILGVLLALIALAPAWLSVRFEERGTAVWRTDADAAFRDLDRAESLSPFAVDPTTNAGLIAVQLGRADQAREAFATSLEREQTWLPHLELSLLAAQDGDRPQAEAQLARARALSPREIVVSKARELLRSGKSMRAAEATRRLFESETP